MRKILILAAVAVLLLSGCVEKKEAESDSPQRETIQDSSKTQVEKAAEEQNEQMPEETQAQEEAGSSEETLSELGDLLEELQDEDFADIDFAE